MTNDDLLKYVNYIARVEIKGKPLTLARYSDLLNVHSLNYYEELYDTYEKTQEISDSLKRFKVSKSGAQINFTGTTIDIPTDYAHNGFLYYKNNGTDVRPIDIVDDDQFMMRQSSSIMVPSATYPIARYFGDYIEYLPTTLNQTYFTFDYLRYPTTPVYDYYIDVNGNYVYLAEGATHTWTTGEIDSEGTTHTTGDADWDSLTIELDFNDDTDRLKIAYKILAEMGVNLNEGGLYEYAKRIENQN
jgi:hypothetical protein